ncbi:MAG: hypothetical protein EBZ48_00955 [Proteobacteria bacterium]|nr:hypothetical protein [Pseudomonadota bacterium]
MKILHTVESYLPARHGMSEVVRQISERLVRRGHHVTVATSADSRRDSTTIEGVAIREFNVYGKSALRLWGDVESYQRFIIQYEPDVLVNFAAQQWATDLVFPLLPKIKARKVFVPTGFSALGDPMFADYFSKMGKWMNSYDACVFLSNSYRDIDFARDAGVKSIVIIPNGAAAEEFDRDKDYGFRDRLGIPNSHQLILHVAGYLSPGKGQAEAVEIFSNSSLKNATLLMICPEFDYARPRAYDSKQILKLLYGLARGRGLRAFSFPSELKIRRRRNRLSNMAQGRQVLGLSLSREDTVSAFLDADALLFPSKIECSPLVLFEAAASMTPFLVTDVGNSREIISWTGGGQLLPGMRLLDQERSVQVDIKGGTRCFDTLMNNQPRRKQMAVSAKQVWSHYFTWSRIADQYETLYATLLADKPVNSLFSAPPAIQ